MTAQGILTIAGGPVIKLETVGLGTIASFPDPLGGMEHLEIMIL